MDVGITKVGRSNGQRWLRCSHDPRRDEEGHWLVTPAEMLRIKVEDTPFLAVDLEVAGRAWGSSMQTSAIGCPWMPPILVARDEARAA